MIKELQKMNYNLQTLIRVAGWKQGVMSVAPDSHDFFKQVDVFLLCQLFI